MANGADAFFAANNKDGWADKKPKGPQQELIGERMKTFIADLAWICAVCVDRYALAYNPSIVDLDRHCSEQMCGWCNKTKQCVDAHLIGDLRSGRPDSIKMPPAHDYHEQPVTFA